VSVTHGAVAVTQLVVLSNNLGAVGKPKPWGSSAVLSKLGDINSTKTRVTQTLAIVLKAIMSALST
jgi:hypothetical protein